MLFSPLSHFSACPIDPQAIIQKLEQSSKNLTLRTKIPCIIGSGKVAYPGRILSDMARDVLGERDVKELQNYVSLL